MKWKLAGFILDDGWMGGKSIKLINFLVHHPDRVKR